MINVSNSNRERTKVCLAYKSLLEHPHTHTHTPALPSCPFGNVDESREPSKLLLKENDIIKRWQTALLGATEQRHLMCVFQ